MKRKMLNKDMKQNIRELSTRLWNWKPGKDEIEFYFFLGKLDAYIEAYGEQGLSAENIMDKYEGKIHVD